MRKITLKFRTFFNALLMLFVNSRINDASKKTKDLNSDTEKAKSKAYDLGLQGVENIDTVITTFKKTVEVAKNIEIGKLDSEIIKTEADLLNIDNDLLLTDKQREERELKNLEPKAEQDVAAQKMNYDNANREKHIVQKKLRKIQTKIKEGDYLNFQLGTTLKIVFIIVLAMLFGLEAVFFTPILEKFGFTYGFALLGSFGFSLILATLSESISHYYYTDKKKYRFSLILSITFVLFLISLRIDANSDHWYFTAPVIGLLFAISTFISLRQAKNRIGMKFFKQEKRLINEINHLDNVMLSSKTQADIIYKEYKQQAKENALNGKSKFRNIKINLEAELEKKKQARVATIDTFDNYEDEKIPEIIDNHKEGLEDRYIANSATKSHTSTGFSSPLLTVFFIASLTLFASCKDEPLSFEQDDFYIHSMFDVSGSYTNDQSIANKIHEEITQNTLKINDLETNGFKGTIQWSSISD